MLGRANGRPSRLEVEPAALALLTRHGAQILSTARRYSATPEDAEDAYQRAFEILLTKAPSTSEDDLVPWLKTVVKHEAFAIRRQRERSAPVSDDGELAEPPAAGAPTHDRAERFERLRLGAEALHRLKPQEVRCLVLRAEGYSYNEICELTGWTYTKVNRCLTEGRRAFLERVAGIEAGSECERLAPTLSALADGEASTEALRALRPHLKTCLACRARLKEFRATPRRVAALLPPAALASSGDGGPVRGFLESLLGAAQDKAAALGERAHAAAELATGQKVAAVAASAAAMAGGGAGVKELAVTDRPPERSAPAKVQRVSDQDAAPAPSPAPAPAPQSAPAPRTSPPQAHAPAPRPAPPPPDPATEFAPGAAAAAPAPPARSSHRAAGGTSGAGAGAAEFGP
jgi:RNA polymerase sigma factor (sigma-70 family)